MSTTTHAKADKTGTTLTKDEEQIVHLHNEFWGANRTLDIPRMKPVFVKGDKYLMYNLNGHPYYGIDEKVKLWEYLKSLTSSDEEQPHRIVRLEIRGNMAWLAAEIYKHYPAPSENETKRLGGESVGLAIGKTVRMRSTEIYHRDDGEGNAEWRMWHFHASQLPDPDETRPPFDDTSRSRGELVP